MSSPLDSLPLDQPSGPGDQIDLTLGAHEDWRRTEPPPAPVRTRPAQGFALGSAAVLSAAAALMAVWLWGQRGTATSQEDATVTVSYEPLEAPSGPDAGPAVKDGRAGAAAATASAAPSVAVSVQETATPPRAEAVRRAAPAPARSSAQPVRPRRPSGSTGLVVITDPPGARVTVNGVGWGAAPLTLGNLSAGTKRVRVSLPGYGSEERVVGADISQTQVTLRIQLRAVPGGGQSR